MSSSRRYWPPLDRGHLAEQFLVQAELRQFAGFARLDFELGARLQLVRWDGGGFDADFVVAGFERGGLAAEEAAGVVVGREADGRDFAAVAVEHGIDGGVGDRLALAVAQAHAQVGGIARAVGDRAGVERDELVAHGEGQLGDPVRDLVPVPHVVLVGDLVAPAPRIVEGLVVAPCPRRTDDRPTAGTFCPPTSASSSVSAPGERRRAGEPVRRLAGCPRARRFARDRTRARTARCAAARSVSVSRVMPSRTPPPFHSTGKSGPSGVSAYSLKRPRAPSMKTIAPPRLRDEIAQPLQLLRP